MDMRMAELPEGTQLVYANWVRTNSSPFDLSIDFGYTTAPGPPDEYPVRVVMSWEEAKGLLSLVAENVADYEDQAGPIRDLFESGPESDADD